MEEEYDKLYLLMLRLRCLWVNLTEMCRRQVTTVTLETVRNVSAGAIDGRREFKGWSWHNESDWNGPKTVKRLKDREKVKELWGRVFERLRREVLATSREYTVWSLFTRQIQGSKQNSWGKDVLAPYPHILIGINLHTHTPAHNDKCEVWMQTVIIQGWSPNYWLRATWSPSYHTGS